MKSARDWTNELDQQARQPRFYEQCLYLVGKIQDDACAPLLGILKEIAKAEGAFSLNPLTHARLAQSTIESMKEIACTAVALAEKELHGAPARPIVVNKKAFPVEWDYGGHYNTGWRVWRPDRTPHIEKRRHETEKQAQKRANKINQHLTGAHTEG